MTFINNHVVSALRFENDEMTFYYDRKSDRLNGMFEKKKVGVRQFYPWIMSLLEKCLRKQLSMHSPAWII